ncbi:MAG TPA: chemotaxis protein CheW, partial [Gammaproteobacteria bacterium]|nr:chemotaxis protein CheW [Gammaproteobacteria bacterium]
MDLDPHILRQLLATFAAELEEQLQAITDHLLQLEQGLEAEERERAYEAIFRSAHNIKGSANGIGILEVGDLAHRLETLFSTLKKENAPPSPDLNDRCLEILDGIRAVHGGWQPDQALPDALQQRYRGLVAALEGLEAGGAGEDTANAAEEGGTAAPAVDQAPEVPEETVNGAVAETESLPGHETEPKPEEPAKGGPGKTGSASGELIRVELSRLNTVSALAEELEVTKVELQDQLGRLRTLEQRLAQLDQVWRKRFPLLEAAIPDQDQSGAATFLRENLDTLGTIRRLHSETFKAFRATSRRFGQLSGGMQQNVRTLQLVEASTLLRPLARTARDTARELGKEVECGIHGEHIRIDRAVLDGVRDPLTHLLRNAVDHGLEDPEGRQAAGKRRKGRVDLTMESGGGRVRIRVEDDGAGIDAEAIAQKAVEGGLITEDELQTMDPEQKLQIIFRPGFSSRAAVTTVSGRGVGLDVVQANIQALKGNVQVESTPGAGTRFLLDLPLTLSTERGLVVRVAGEEFAIPSTAVERVAELDRKELTNVEASNAILHEGRPVPLRDLATILERPASDLSRWQTLPVVVLSQGWNTVAVVVEAILRDREIVVKNLQPPLVAVRNVSGATLTGSGEIMMVLNPADVVRSGLGGTAQSLGALDEEEEREAPHILVVDDSITTRMLERNVLEKQGYRVTVATHGRQAWELLQTNAIDLVITDIQMPLMDGFELTETIKQSEEYQDTP